MASNVHFLGIDIDRLDALRFDADGSISPTGSAHFGECIAALVRADREDEALEVAFEDTDALGLRFLCDTFEGAYAVVEDLKVRMAPVAGKPYVQAIANGVFRLPPSAADHAGLRGLHFENVACAVLDRSELVELVDAAATALTADPEWAEAGHDNGPTWGELVESVGEDPPPYAMVLML